MSWLQPFYGGTLAGQRLARFLNSFLLIAEMIFVTWHVIAITDGGWYQPYWAFWVIYPFLVLIAMMIIGSVLGFICRLYLGIKYGTINPNEVEALGHRRDVKRQQKDELRRAAEKKAGTWKEEDSADPYNLEKNRDLFRKL